MQIFCLTYAKSEKKTVKKFFLLTISVNVKVNLVVDGRVFARGQGSPETSTLSLPPVTETEYLLTLSLQYEADK